jgi:hypothetical protein
VASYFVPWLGPLVYMTPATEAQAERAGKKIERREFSDLDAARAFARHIFSRVEEEKGKVVWDSRQPAPQAAPSPTPQAIPQTMPQP